MIDIRSDLEERELVAGRLAPYERLCFSQFMGWNARKVTETAKRRMGVECWMLLVPRVFSQS